MEVETAVPVNRFSKSVELAWSLLLPVLATLAALLIAGILIITTGVNPIAAYEALVRGALGSPDSVAEVLVKTTPLLLAGLGVGVAFRSGIFNIGAEGQLYLGAMAATWVGVNLAWLPAAILFPLTLTAGFVSGAAWAAIPGALKAYLRVNEVIVTLMLNYIALQLVSYVVNGPWKDPLAVEPYTSLLAPATLLPIILQGTRLHAGIIVGICAAVLVYILLWRTTLGYRMLAVGANSNAARYGGIPTAPYLVLAMLLSGGLAGLAGYSEVAGLHHRLLLNISPEYGYTAIAVALMGRLHPAGTIVTAFLFAALAVGADSMQRMVRVPVALVFIVQGLIILGVLASEYLIKRREG